jgi:hypothetical protein
MGRRHKRKKKEDKEKKSNRRPHDVSIPPWAAFRPYAMSCKSIRLGRPNDRHLDSPMTGDLEPCDRFS